MFFPKTNVKADPVRRWHRPDRHFFANGACHILAFAFLERHATHGFHARWIKPARGYSGNHIYVTNGVDAFDCHGFTREQRLLALAFRRAQRFFPGWDATLVDLPTEVLGAALTKDRWPLAARAAAIPSRRIAACENISGQV